MVTTSVLLLLVVMVGSGLVQAQSESPAVDIAIVTDGPSERAVLMRRVFLEEIRTVNQGEFRIRAPDDLQLEGDWSLDSVQRQLDQVLADRRTDLVLTLGVLGSHAAATRKSLPKPVLAPFVANRGLQNLPFKDGTSGRRNLSYVSLDVNIERDVAVFRDIVSFSKLTFVLDRAMADAIPTMQKALQAAAEEHGINVTRVLVGDSAQQALQAIPTDSQAVYVGPLLRLNGKDFQQLVDGLIQRRLPSFAFMGKSDVERGLLVGVAPAIEFERLARRVALNARRILLGENAGDIEVRFAREEGLTINMRTARAIDFSPSWRLLTSAELLHEEREAKGEPLTLSQAVSDAVELNLTLRVAQSNVSAGKQSIRQARSALLPQIGLGGQHLTIDDDDAAALPGGAERTIQGSLTLNQPLFSEPAWANLAIQKQLQVARQRQRDQVRLDIVLETTQAYLDVLRAKTNARIQKDNLRLTRSNLSLARARRRIGTAGPSEVFRWESEIANAHRAVVQARSRERVAEIALNSLLHRTLEDSVNTVEVGLDEPVLIASQEHLYELIDNPKMFRVFRDFVVDDAFAAVPELQQLDAQIQAQERTLASARRAFTLPSLNLQAARTETFDRDGVEGPALPGMDDSQTSLRLQLSYPLFTSGSRSARKQQALEELSGLRLQRQAVAEQVERRVRSTLHTARAAYTSIRLSRDAAEAAGNNLEVVRDAYSRGAVSILDLLDAQNAALVADLSAATAVYAFISRLMEVERAAARFDFFLTPRDQQQWFQRLEQYFTKRGVALP